MIRRMIALLIVALMGLQGAASANGSGNGVLAGGGLTSAAPRPTPIVLTNRELIGYGIPRTFNIPDQPPATDTLRVQLFTRQWTRVGGQNRSGQVHPGFDYDLENPSHARASLQQNFYDDDGHAGLPGSWNAHLVLWEWGPTLPASPEEFIDPEDWEWACENNPTCYWGAATYDGAKSHRDNWREYTIQQGSPWYPAAQVPGSTIHYVPTLEWLDYQGVWDGSHAWPVAIRWEQTTLLWLSWE